MSSGFRLEINNSALADFAESADMDDLLQDVGDVVAENAAEAAPKDTGAGAASIFAEVSRDADGSLVNVSYDADHWYMGLQEVGTIHQPPQPFLRPALDSTRI